MSNVASAGKAIRSTIPAWPVVDTSFFPSIGAVNPALTAMANSLRVGDHLLARMA